MKVKTKLIGSFIGIVSVCGLTMAIPLLVSTFKSLRQNIHQIARLEIEQINSKVSAFLEPPLESIDASLNFIDFLVFGTEDNNLALLEQYATLFLEEPEDFKILLKNHLVFLLALSLNLQDAEKIEIVSSLKDLFDLYLTDIKLLELEYLKMRLKPKLLILLLLSMLLLLQWNKKYLKFLVKDY